MTPNPLRIGAIANWEPCLYFNSQAYLYACVIAQLTSLTFQIFCIHCVHNEFATDSLELYHPLVVTSVAIWKQAPKSQQIPKSQRLYSIDRPVGFDLEGKQFL